jgi:nucleoside-diphosphate-sugar epimerase
MLVALSGASGFVGSYTAKSLRGAGHRVRALVRSESRRDHVAPFVDEWTVGDQSDPQVQAALVAGVDAVIHNSADWEALEQSPVRNFERNVLASLRLLDAARTAGVEQFLFVSSVAVYQEIPESQGGRITEETPAWPGSIYGAYKAAVEPHLKAYHHTYGMNTSAWRPAAIYGVPPKLEEAQWLDLVRAGKRGDHVSTDKGGKITHVQDVADALTLAVGDPTVSGQFYNLVDCYMYWQVAAEFAKQLGGSSAMIEERKRGGPRNQFDSRKAIAFFDRHGNTTALRRGTDGVRQYVAELLSKI